MTEEVLELVRKGLAVSESPGPAAANKLAPAVISTDPVTGLPVIISPPDAPISRMTPEEIQSIIDQTLLEQDLERAGIPPRR